MKEKRRAHEKLSSLYNFLLSSLFTFFAPRGASRRAPPKESRELVNKRIVPKEPNFQASSWDSRTCYPRRAFNQGLTDNNFLVLLGSPAHCWFLFRISCLEKSANKIDYWWNRLYFHVLISCTNDFIKTTYDTSLDSQISLLPLGFSSTEYLWTWNRERSDHWSWRKISFTNNFLSWSRLVNPSVNFSLKMVFFSFYL